MLRKCVFGLNELKLYHYSDLSQIYSAYRHYFLRINVSILLSTIFLPSFFSLLPVVGIITNLHCVTVEN